jgi:hypothetical protein
MTPLEAFQELREFAERAKSANMLMAANGDQDDDSISLQRLSLAKEVSDDFLHSIVSTMGKEGDQPDLFGYDPGYEPNSNELCYIKPADYDLVSAMIDSVSDVDRAEIFRAEDDFIDRLRFYAIVPENKSQKSVFLRLYSRNKELTRSRTTAIWEKKDRYDHVDRKIFLLDEKFDCFWWKDYLFIKSAANFQKIFGYFEQLVAEGKRAVKQVISRIPIKNPEEFVAGMEADPRMLARVAQAVRKPYFKKLTMARIKRTIADFHLDCQVVDDGGTEKLLFERGTSTRWIIPNILDDYFVESRMTDTKYKANSKVAV